ncbi:MAG: hypothetical protein AB7T37_08665 [Dehalococcoidia bacterium]
MSRDLGQEAYTATLRHFVATGRAPHFTELARTVGCGLDEALAAQRDAASRANACWFAEGTDVVGAWPPFSNTPTPYLISVNGEQRWYGQ